MVLRFACPFLPLLVLLYAYVVAGVAEDVVLASRQFNLPNRLVGKPVCVTCATNCCGCLEGAFMVLRFACPFLPLLVLLYAYVVAGVAEDVVLASRQFNLLRSSRQGGGEVPDTVPSLYARTKPIIV